MLALRPNCECCDKDLPPNSEEAFICSYECTFCKSCVDTILDNVCPNCGGGFSQRPVRPKHAYREGISVEFQKPVIERTHMKYSQDQVKEFAKRIKETKAHDR